MKSPVEFLVGAMRATGLNRTPLWAHGSLERMGQILFRPPSVKGWPSGAEWLTSASVVERLKAARKIAATRPDAADGIVALAFDGAAPATLDLQSGNKAMLAVELMVKLTSAEMTTSTAMITDIAPVLAVLAAASVMLVPVVTWTSWVPMSS